MKSGETEENLAKALADHEKAILLDDTSAEAYLGLVDVYIRRGDAETALEILQRALKIFRDRQEIIDKISKMKETILSLTDFFLGDLYRIRCARARITTAV